MRRSAHAQGRPPFVETVAGVPGVSADVFNEKVDVRKKNCPISKALASIPELAFKATLE